MNDEQVQSTLETWFEDTDPQGPDPQRITAQVMARVPQTRQRGRWLPFQLFRHRVRTPTIDNTTKYQPSPTPATNGHTATIIGRTSSMLSPVKAITAGALVFALGGAFLIAQPFGQGGSVPGAESEDVAATWVTGDVQYASSCSGPDYEYSGVVRQARNYECSPQTWTSSDPRLTGEVSRRWNEDVYQTDEGFIAVNTDAAYLRNDDGDWACSASNLYKNGGLFPEVLTGETFTCIGDGGYEGLLAVLVVDQESSSSNSEAFVGLVFSGDFPPLAEAPATE